MRKGSLIFLSVMFLVMIASGPSFSFPISNQPSVPDIGLAGAGDGNGNFLVSIAQGTWDVSGPIKAVLFKSDGTILKTIDTGRRGFFATGVAFDGTKYLMTWEDSNGNTQRDYSYLQIWGLFVDKNGNSVGQPFSISSKGIDGDSVKRIAFDGSNKYLVVYTKLIDPSQGKKYDNMYIAGRIVSTDGTVGPEFRISSGNGRMPAVDFDGTNFLVVWIEDSKDKIVMARFVAPDGTLGVEFEVDSDPRCSDNPPYVKFGLGSYLIAYHEQRGTDYIPCSQAGTGNWDIKGIIVGTDGKIISGPFYIKQNGSQIVPTIGFDGKKFIVAYNDYTPDTSNLGVCDSTEGTCWDIRARYVSTKDMMIGNPFDISAGAGIEFGGIIEYDSSAGFLALINKCGSTIFSSECDVYGEFIGGGTTTNHAPSKPTLIYPSNGSTNLPTAVTFKWTKSTDPDGDTIKYKLYYGTDQSFTNVQPITVASNSNSHGYAFASLYQIIPIALFGGVVSLVVSRKRKGIGIVIMAIIIAGVLVLGSCGGGGDSGGGTGGGTGGGGTGGGGTGGGGTGGGGNPPSQEVSYTVSGLQNGTTYYWKVVADDGKGGVTESELYKFTTAP
ncbi:MAG: hypothetical protein ACK4TF_00500 [Thermodesulfovibrionales bacterium]